jgi:hypothetical protein
MARAAKPQHIEDYRFDRLGVRVSLCFDKNRADFCFVLGGTTFRKPSIEELRRLAHDQILATHDLQWQPIITVNQLKPFACQERSFVGFTLDRSWIAKKANDDWVEHRWEEELEEGDPIPDQEKARKDWISEAHYFAGRDFTLHVLSADWQHDENRYHLPYTDNVWANLLRIVDQIEVLRDRLNALLTTPEGLARLEAPGIKLLT